MNIKRIAMMGGGVAALGATAFAASQYLDIDGLTDDESELADASGSELANEATATNCGLNNGSDATATAGAIGASATRARIVVAQALANDEQSEVSLAAGDCRLRLDGVWSEDVPLALDNSVVIDGFEPTDGGTLDKKMLHGTYVTPRLVLIETSEDGAKLTIRDGNDPDSTVVAVAASDEPLADVLQKGTDRKAYLVAGQSEVSDEGSLFVDVTRSGRVRIRWAGQNYYRPQADALAKKETSASDAWMIERNLDNLGASLRGYDLYKQDLFYLNNNEKAEVFQAADAFAYTVTEKRTVPLGLKLVPEGAQGTVTSSRLIRTEREFQKTVTQSVGAKVGFESEGASGGVGAEYTKSQTAGMREGSAHSIASGFARHKIYALVLDEPFVRLSDEFIDAVEDARKYERYDELIERFGTHYPYAVTYGSAGRMTARFTENTVSQWQAESEDINAQAGFAIGGLGVSFNASQFVSEENKEALSETVNGGEFVAVGGNGSFGSEGHQSGTPYPILADLRPLYELLNPLNFPGEPQVYGEVRNKLKSAISAYLAKHATSINDTIPEIEQQYTVTPKRIRCERDVTSAWATDNGKVTLKGGVNFTHLKGAGRTGPSKITYGFPPPSGGEFVINCKSGRKYFDFPGNSMTITGPRSKISGNRFEWSANIDGGRHVAFAGMQDYFDGRVTGFNLPVDLRIGEAWPHKATIIDKPNYPKLTLETEVKRIR